MINNSELPLIGWQVVDCDCGGKKVVWLDGSVKEDEELNCECSDKVNYD